MILLCFSSRCISSNEVKDLGCLLASPMCSFLITLDIAARAVRQAQHGTTFPLFPQSFKHSMYLKSTYEATTHLTYISIMEHLPTLDNKNCVNNSNLRQEIEPHPPEIASPHANGLAARIPTNPPQEPPTSISTLSLSWRFKREQLA